MLIVIIFFLVLGIEILIKMQVLKSRGQWPPVYAEAYRHEIPLQLRSYAFAASYVGNSRYSCVYCGRVASRKVDPDGRPWEIDHVIPFSRGGLTVPNNLVLSCSRCNQTKGAAVWQPTYIGGRSIAVQTGTWSNPGGAIG